MIISTPLVTLADGVSFELRHHDLLPDLTPEQYADLREDIRGNGILVPVVCDEWNVVIDGQHRLKIAKELGLSSSDVPQQLHLREEGASVADQDALARHLALTLNLHRRHIDVETRAKLVELLKVDGLSNRAIADQVGVSEKTVRRDLQKCSTAANAAVEHPRKGDIDERREKVATLQDEGKSVRTIAKEVGASVGTVARDIKARAEEPEPEPEVVDPFWDRMQEKADALRAQLEDSEATTEPEPEERLERKDHKVRTYQAPEKAEPVTKLQKISADRWKVVDDDGELVGLITRGSPGASRTTSSPGFTGYVIIDGEEHFLYPVFGDSHESLKAIREAIDKALADVEDFQRGNASRKRFQSDCISHRSEHKKPQGKRWNGKVNDLELDNGGWKNYEDLITSSLWLLGPRAKGDGRSGKYHGNFVPQIPDQMLRRYTCAGDVVVDMFLGGATAMVEAVRLGRHFAGVDIQQEQIDAGYELLADLDNPHDVEAKLICADSRGAIADHSIRDFLTEHHRAEADHVFLHPPYWDIIKFTDDDRDLSGASSLDDFISRFRAVAWRAVNLLGAGKYLTLVIGDCVKGSEWIPLSTYCMQVLMHFGLELQSKNVKDIQGNEKGKGKNANLWRCRCLTNGTATFDYEYVMVFRKVAYVEGSS